MQKKVKILLLLLVLTVVLVSGISTVYAITYSFGALNGVTGTTSANAMVPIKVSEPVFPRYLRVKAPGCIMVGETRQIITNVYPSNAIRAVIYTSSDSNIATVSNSGVVRGVKPGVALIYVTSPKCGRETVTIRVTDKEPDHEFTLSDTHITLTEEETKLLLVEYNADSKVGPITFSSSNSNVATVDENGLITAKKEGSAIIKVSTLFGTKTCDVHVIKKPAMNEGICIRFSKGGTTYAVHDSVEGSIVARTVPIASPGDKVCVSVDVRGDELDYISYSWNDTGVALAPSSYFETTVPGGTWENMELTVSVRSSTGTTYTKSITFVSSRYDEEVKVSFSLKGTTYAQYSNHGTEIICKSTPFAEAGVNLVTDISVLRGKIKSYSYRWETGEGGTRLFGSFGVEDTCFAIPVPFWGSKTTNMMTFTVYTAAGTEFTRTFTVYKKIEAPYIEVEFSNNGQVYAISSNRGLYNYSQRRLSAKAGDFVDVKVTLQNAQMGKVKTYWASTGTSSVKQFNGETTEFNFKVEVPKMNRQRELDSLTLAVYYGTDGNNTSVYTAIPLDVVRTDYEPENIVIQAVYKGQVYAESTNVYGSSQRILAEVGDAITVKINPIQGNVTNATYSLGNKYNTPIKLSSGVTETSIKIPSYFTNGNYNLVVNAVGSSGRTYILNQPISIQNEKISVDISYVEDAYKGRYKEGTLMWGLTSNASKARPYLKYSSTSKNGVTIIDNSNDYHAGEWLLISATSDVKIKNLAVNIDGNGEGGVGHVYGINTLSMSKILEQSRTSVGKHKIIVLVTTIDDKTYSFDSEFTISPKQTSDLTVDVDLSKTYDYDDSLTLKLNRKIKDNEWFGIHTINSKKEYTSYKGTGEDTLEIPVHEFLWTCYAVNDTDYRTDPIRLKFTTGTTGNQIELKVNTHCDDNILKVTSRYMDEIEAYIDELSSYDQGFFAASARKGNADVKISEIYNTQSSVSGGIIPEMFPGPVICRITFTKDGRFEKSAQFGMNQNYFLNSSAKERGTIKINPAQKYIRFYNAGRSAPGNIIRVKGFDIKEFEYWEYSVNKESYYVTFKTMYEYDMPPIEEPFIAYINEVVATITEHGVNYDNGKSYNYIRAIPQGKEKEEIYKVDINADMPDELWHNGKEPNGILATITFDKGSVCKVTYGVTSYTLISELKAGLIQGLAADSNYEEYVLIDDTEYRVDKKTTDIKFEQHFDDVIAFQVEETNNVKRIVVRDILTIADLAKSTQYEVSPSGENVIVVKDKIYDIDGYRYIDVSTTTKYGEKEEVPGYFGFRQKGFVHFSRAKVIDKIPKDMLNVEGVYFTHVVVNEKEKIAYFITINTNNMYGVTLDENGEFIYQILQPIAQEPQPVVPEPIEAPEPVESPAVSGERVIGVITQTISTPAINGVVVPATTFVKITKLNGDNKGISETNMGRGTITEKDIPIKWGDVLQLELLDSQAKIKTIEIITEGIDTKYSLSDFPTNVIVDPKDRDAERYIINFKYFDENGKPVLDSNGNVIVDTVFNAVITK